MSEHEEKPTLEIQRRILEQKRDEFRARGFEAELEIATLLVQKVPREKERERSEVVDNFRNTRDNCYASAKELGKLLNDIPPKGEA